jgi:serine/threonine protein kinase
MGEGAWGPPLAGRYHLAEQVGRGAVADVFRAHDNRLGRSVAVKLFRADRDPVARLRFVEEIRVLARLSHPWLVPILDAGVAGERPYLVMRLVEGQSLRERLRVGPLTAPAVASLGARLANALGHVHRNGLVHRDVKPSNILLDDTERPYLVDFGIALSAGAPRLTAADEIVGSAAYLAPEQVHGGELGPPVDVYALGLVLLECLTGELAYPGTNKLDVAFARLQHPPHVPPGLPVELGVLLTAMTQPEPPRRPTARDCAQGLLAIERRHLPDQLAAFRTTRSVC